MNIPQSLAVLGRAYDKLTGQPGAAAKLTPPRLGAIGRITKLAEAFDQALTATPPAPPAATTPATANKSGAQNPSRWSLAFASALIDAVGGPGSAREILQVPLSFEVSGRPCGYAHSVWQVEQRRAAFKSQQQVPAERDQVDTLRRAIWRMGVSIDGLTDNLRISDYDREAREQHPRRVTTAQRLADQFMQVVEGAAAGEAVSGNVGKFAREFLASKLPRNIT
jgi:hypothetical protein